MLGLLFAGSAFADVKLFGVFDSPSYLISVACILNITVFMVWTPLKSSQESTKESFSP